MRRLLAIVLMLLPLAGLAGLAPARPAGARQADFPPDAVAAALQAATIPGDDEFWTGPAMSAPADSAIGQLYVIEVPTIAGVVVFEVYPDAATAAANLVTEGEQATVDQQMINGSDNPASPAAMLRQEQAPAIAGATLITLDTGNGTASCGQSRNVLVCGVTPGSGDTSPFGPAATSALNGLAMLAMLASQADAAAGAEVVAAQDAPTDGSRKDGKKNRGGDQPPADQPPAEQPPAEQPPVDQPPAEQPPAEQPPVAAPAVGGISGAVIPQFAIPGGLNAPGGIAYAVTLARPIDLELIGNGKVQAVLGYTEDEVRWILAHPKFLDGEPYAQVTEALSRRGSSLIARYADPGAVAGKLAGLGWIDGYQRVFSLGWPPATVPGYVDVTVSRFRDGASAVSAVDALAGQMIADGGMLQVPWGPYGEKAIGFTGSDINGMQRVGFAAAGPYLITVTAVAPQGDPVATVNGIVAYIIETVSAGG